MPHDFKKFPELTDNQARFYYHESPHRQIFDDFWCNVTKVHDGDTIKVRWAERDFEFPVRLIEIAAPELNEEGGRESQSWLEDWIKGAYVKIEIDPNNRVCKWGRILGRVFFEGRDMNEQSLRTQHSILFEDIN